MRSYVTFWATGGALPMTALSSASLTADPACTYSTTCSFLRSWLFRAVEASLVRNVPQYDDRPEQSPALIVADIGTEPVVAWAVEVDGGRSSGKYRQPNPLAVTIARQERAVSVRVIVDEFDLEVAPMGHD